MRTARSSLLALALVALGGATALGSDADLSGAAGHPKARLPLGLHAASTGDAGLDAAVRQAVADWNALARETLGVDVFAPVARDSEAQVLVAFGGPHASGLMGQAEVGEREEVIELPVRVEVFAPERRGATTRETLLYQILAHELGHALGLPHAADPASIMCCAAGQGRSRRPGDARGLRPRPPPPRRPLRARPARRALRAALARRALR